LLVEEVVVVVFMELVVELVVIYAYQTQMFVDLSQ
jgi:hypothetical protein